MKRKSPDYGTIFIISFAILLGGYFRLRPALLSNFPLNDGGLFYQMTKDLIDHHFALPFYTTYNGSDIPFAYPPLAFYLMAVIKQLFHVGIIDQLRFLPALFSTLSIPALYFLSRSVTDSKEKSAFAIFAYALMPSSFLWLIMGGGVTRSLGLWLGILALYCVRELFKKPKVSLLILSILFCSLTILSHPGTAWFVFITAALIFFSYGLNKKGAVYASIVIAGTAILTSPWWITITHNHGFSGILNTASSGGIFSPSIFISYFTREPYVTILAVLSIFGIFAELIRRRYFLFLWMVVIMFLSPRSGDTFAAIPGSMLVASGIIWILIPGLLSGTKQLLQEHPSLEQIFSGRIPKIMFAYILIIAVLSPMSITYGPETTSLFQDDRTAMVWISQNTSIDDRFIVLSGINDWSIDNISEWFPTLTSRKSIATIQGIEWLPRDDSYYRKYIDLQNCVNFDASCLNTWAEEYGTPFSYIYLHKPKVGKAIVGPPIYYSLNLSDQYQLVFYNARVSIYRLKNGP